MGQWRSLPSKETQKLFLWKLATTRLGLLACLILHPSCFLKTFGFSGTLLPSGPFQFPLLTALSQTGNIPLRSLILFFFSLHTNFPNMCNLQAPVSSSCPLQNSCPAFSTLYNIFALGRLACLSHSASNLILSCPRIGSSS